MRMEKKDDIQNLHDGLVRLHWVLQQHVRSFVRFTPLTRQELKDAVVLWCDDENNARKLFWDISLWDVSNIRDMSLLFHKKKDFNSDISRWDVSKVTDMNLMFAHAYAFNQAIGGWTCVRSQT